MHIKFGLRAWFGTKSIPAVPGSWLSRLTVGEYLIAESQYGNPASSPPAHEKVAPSLTGGADGDFVLSEEIRIA